MTKLEEVDLPSRRNLSFTDDFAALVTNRHPPFSVSSACSRFRQLLKTIPDTGGFDLRPLQIIGVVMRRKKDTHPDIEPYSSKRRAFDVIYT